MLTARREAILRAIVDDYVQTVMPVGSEALARKHGLGVSPATIRNEVADLEEGGYVFRPHTSAGSVPLDRGYRHYVEYLICPVELSPKEREEIRRRFSQVELEEWTRLAAALLSQIAQNLVAVTYPKLVESRLKHLELVYLQKFLALLVLVFQEAELRRQVLALKEPLTQDELSLISNKFNTLFAGLTRAQMMTMQAELSPVEEQIADALVRTMKSEDENRYPEPYIDGLRRLMDQPEFHKSVRLRSLVELVEDKSLIRDIFSRILPLEGVRIVIGAENEEEALHQCSVILTTYGIPGEVGGILGVIGPTRMEYNRAITAVTYLSALMGELLQEVHG